MHIFMLRHAQLCLFMIVCAHYNLWRNIFQVEMSEKLNTSGIKWNPSSEKMT